MPCECECLLLRNPLLSRYSSSAVGQSDGKSMPGMVLSPQPCWEENVVQPSGHKSVIQKMQPLTLSRNTFSLHWISLGSLCQLLSLNAGVVDSYSTSVSCPEKKHWREARLILFLFNTRLPFSQNESKWEQIIWISWQKLHEHTTFNKTVDSSHNAPLFFSPWSQEALLAAFS